MPGLGVAIAALLVLACGWWLWPRVKRAYHYRRKISESGYLPPAPTEDAAKLATKLANVVLFLFVGKVKIHGIENIDALPAPALIIPNHSHGADPFVMARVLNRPTRYMAGHGILRVFGSAAARSGAFSIAFGNPSEAVKALDASVKLLLANENVCVYPEGELFEPVGQFKSGAVRIAARASQQLGKPIAILPVMIRYGRYPGKWVHYMPDYIRYLMPALIPLWYRRGVTVVVGKHFLSSELSANVHEASRQLRERVVALDTLSK